MKCTIQAIIKVKHTPVVGSFKPKCYISNIYNFPKHYKDGYTVSDIV